MDGSDGGGATGNATVNVTSCTFNGNFGYSIYLSETTSGTTVLHIGNTILKAVGVNFVFDNISGGTVTVISHGYNLSSDNGSGVLTGTGDQLNTDPLLDPLGLKANGGLTPTIALQSTSPALDKGNSNTVSLTNFDQRNEFRPFDDPNVANATGGDGTDIGAYEGTLRVTATTRIVNDLQFTFLSILGATYEIQSRPTLTSGTWSALVPPVQTTGNGGTVQLTVTNALSNPKYYRVHQLP
jgi:hypothetical protein